jgi:Tfp pilus assembly pilus retraction ATPase PilT
VWADRFGDEPEGDVGQLLKQMLRSVAFQTLGSMSEREESAEAMEVMLLAKAMKDLAGADKLAADRILMIRREVAKQAATEAVKEAKAGGLSDEAAEAIRQKILGVV